MFDLQSCRITGRETRSDASNMFTVHIVFYESIFVDESKEEYVYSDELIYVNKVPALVDCLNHTYSVFYNKDMLIPIHKKHITFFEISSKICSRRFDLYINGFFYKRDVDVDDLSDVYRLLKRSGLYVYDVTQSLIAPSEYNLLVSEKENKTC